MGADPTGASGRHTGTVGASEALAVHLPADKPCPERMTLNNENLERTRDLSAAKPSEYRQHAWPDPGDTPVGIAGSAAAACGATLIGARVVEWEEPDGTKRRADVEAYATRVLELNAEQASEMFAAMPFDAERRTWIRHPSAAQAIAMLERVIETGEVRWRMDDDAQHPDGGATTREAVR